MPAVLGDMAKALAAMGITCAVAFGGCGAGHPATRRVANRPDIPKPSDPASPAPASASRPDPPLRALVTAQVENRLLLVALPGGRVIRQASVGGDPSYVDAGGVVVLVSTDPGAVTLLEPGSLRVIKMFRSGFDSPHIPALSPDWQYAYVTDDGNGELSVINLATDRLTSRVFVGIGAHHLAFSPDEKQVWVALGQTAHVLTLLSTAEPGHPRVIGHFTPPFAAHDVLFSPGGKEVWLTSADTSHVDVFSARTRRLLFSIPAGAPPQHIAFASGDAYITSGYGSSIERVDLFTGRVLARTSAPYGSFDLDAARNYVVTASLFRGTLAVYDRSLRLLRIAQLAPSTEDVALSAR